jgi:predicted HD superfamily hydrolase involved in NAD metabolism
MNLTSPQTHYTPEFEAQIMAWARKKETPRRFAHTQRVVETATLLAEKWAPDQVMVCRLAGWIHDAVKHKPPQNLYRLAQKFGVEISPAERQTPMLLHGVVAYHKAAKKFDFQDEQIRTACAYHTTGHPDMNLVDKLVFLADLTEPERDFPLVETLRQVVMVSVNKAMLLAIDGTLQYLLARKRLIDPRVLLLYNVLIMQEYPSLASPSDAASGE